MRSVGLVAAMVVGCSYQPSPATDPLADGPRALDDTLPDDGPDPGPFLAGFAHRKSITLLASKIEAPAEGLSNFPVLISLDDPQIAAGLTRDDGSDLAFTAADALTVLAHELESFEGGRLVAWVKLPTLSATVDTTIYLYYGNPAAPASTPTEVWTESFRAVYHLGQDPGPDVDGAIRDATASAIHGTAETSMTTSDSVSGQIGRGIDFDGSNDCIEIPSLDVGNAFTISTWINLNNVSQIRSLISNSSDGSTTNGFRFFVNTNGTSDRRVRFETGANGGTDSAVTPGGAITAGQWTHVAAIVDRTGGTATIVIDGVIANAGDTSIRSDFSTSSDLEIGRMETNNPFAGVLDELVIASTVRPLEWIQTAVNNQRVPGEFYVVGAEESP